MRCGNQKSLMPLYRELDLIKDRYGDVQNALATIQSNGFVVKKGCAFQGPLSAFLDSGPGVK
jgi:hypothetical protein